MGDLAVSLKQGCHPAITQDCCVIYEEAEVVKVSAIQAALNANALTASAEPLPAGIVEQVEEGVFDSEDTPMRVVMFCTNRF